MWICLRLKDFRIPAYVTERPMDDSAWRMPYLLLSIGLSVAAAVLMTYFYERPVSQFLFAHAPRWSGMKQQKKTGKHEKRTNEVKDVSEETA